VAITNWGGHYSFTADTLHRPASLDELRSIVASNASISAVGSRHSFTGIADSGSALVQLDQLIEPVHIDVDRRVAQVSAAMEVGAVARSLAREGWGLENLPGLPNMTIAGACATATHGSGDNFSSLSSLVSAVTLVTHDGALLTIDREDARFGAAVVSLGAAGVVVSLQLDLVDDYRVRQTVERSGGVRELVDNLDAIMASATRVSVFVDPAAWNEAAPTTIVRKQNLAADDDSADDHDFSASTTAGAAMTFDRTREGSWARLLPHFVYPSLPATASEIQSEYFVTREFGADAVRTVRSANLDWSAHLVTAEIRTVARDDQWLSPMNRGDSLALHFTWHGHPTEVSALSARIESVLEPFDPVPHWGKVFHRPPAAVGRRYPQRDRARSVLDALDPNEKFRTPTVKEALGG
jgi:xylitol oxidase